MSEKIYDDFSACFDSLCINDELCFQSKININHALDKATRGDVENGLIFAGSNAGRAAKIMPVAELMQELVN